jgi:cell division protein ZapA (FtsZ GTPase activity inhibitor)
MKEVSRQSSITDAKKIAVLSALRIAERLLRFERECDKEEQKKLALKNYIDQELTLLNL